MAIGGHRHWRHDGLWPRALALLAVVALLQTTLLTAFTPGGAGWMPSHGHVALRGLPTHHAHPWDASAEVGSDADASRAGIAFTSAETLAGAGIAVPLLPGAAFRAGPSALRSTVTGAPPSPAPREVFRPVESPPPQG